jgi:hypothetical protein
MNTVTTKNYILREGQYSYELQAALHIILQFLCYITDNIQQLMLVFVYH